MRISIITCTRNSSTTIGGCIKSINDQTWPDIEHIIVDGSSEDDTLEIVRRTSKKTPVIISEPPKGIYHALNTGIKNASGDVIGILHSDDEFASPLVLSEIYHSINGTFADIVYGDLVYVKYSDLNNVVRYWKSNPFERSLITKGWMPAHPTMFIRRNVFTRLGYYDLQFSIAADYDFILRALSDNQLKVEYLPKIVTKMRMGGVSNKSFKTIFLKSTEDYNVIRKNGIPFPIRVLARKNVSKLSQFMLKYFIKTAGLN